jgi:arylsulfatase A
MNRSGYRCAPTPRLALVVLLFASAASAADQPAVTPPPDTKGAAANAAPPNVVIIFCDDLGYSDVGCFGAQGFETPSIDRMARQGRRFTNFYVAQGVCSSSRAALMTGCYPNRIGIVGALWPKDRQGISDRELTIGNLLQARGYATAIVGKWHLGHYPQFLPTRHGFDEYLGIPFSNDMGPRQPDGHYADIPLYDGEEIIERGPDPSQLTRRYTERAVDFIERKHDRPFLLYLAHAMPHMPLGASEPFRGKSAAGLFGDVVTEIDWSVGQVLDALDRHNLAEKTLVIFTSDNGPWLPAGNHGGSARPLREGKGTAFEGGVREPCIMRWPGHIPADTSSDEPVMTIDLLPTIARLAGAEVPQDRVIDGRDIWPLIAGEPDARNPHEVLYFYWLHELQAVRSGQWKLHVPHNYLHPAVVDHDGGYGKNESRHIDLSLFDLASDPGETTDVAAEHPDIVQRLQRFVQAAREDLGDSAKKMAGANVRPAGQVAE